MKVWNGYGSEHSANLVMIGHFKKADDASKAKEIIDAIGAQVSDEDQSNSDNPPTRYTDGMSKVLEKVKVYSIAPNEFEQFRYDVRIEVRDNDLVVTTDEADISGFLKVLIEKGARVEIYSAHDYPKAGYGRDTSGSE